MRSMAAGACMAALMLAGCSAAPAALDAPKRSAAPDQAALLAASCSGCHGQSATGATAIPQIRGLGAEAVQATLLAFRDGKRAGTLMPRLMRGYSDAQIALISRQVGAP